MAFPLTCVFLLLIKEVFGTKIVQLPGTREYKEEIVPVKGCGRYTTQRERLHKISLGME